MKSDWNQTWFIDIIWLPSWSQSRGHITRLKVNWGQVVRLKIWMNSKFEIVSFEKMKSDFNQTWFYGCNMGTFTVFLIFSFLSAIITCNWKSTFPRNQVCTCCNTKKIPVKAYMLVDGCLQPILIIVKIYMLPSSNGSLANCALLPRRLKIVIAL